MIWLVFSSLFQAHPKISELFDEADFKSAVVEIMTGAKCESVGGFPVAEKLREQLERSSTEIFPFFEACSRKVHTTSHPTVESQEQSKNNVNGLKSEIRNNPDKKASKNSEKNTNTSTGENSDKNAIGNFVWSGKLSFPEGTSINANGYIISGTMDAEQIQNSLRNTLNVIGRLDFSAAEKENVIIS